jgi:hypothetical protein
MDFDGVLLHVRKVSNRTPSTRPLLGDERRRCADCSVRLSRRPWCSAVSAGLHSRRPACQVIEPVLRKDPSACSRPRITGKGECGWGRARRSDQP